MTKEMKIKVAKAQYQAAINMCDWKWADRIEKEVPEVKNS